MEGVNTMEPSFFKARQTRVTFEDGFAHRILHFRPLWHEREFPPIFFIFYFVSKYLVL